MTLLSIIIPFHHEEKSIAQILHGIQKSLTIPHEILLIYDDKEDSSIAIIKNIQIENASIQLLQNQHKAGVPGAIKTGLERSSGTYILFLVADDLGPIAIINPMLKLMDQGYDLVSGTRYSRGGSMSGTSPLAKLISAWGNQLFSWLSSSKLSDLTCGIKMFRKDILKKIDLKAKADWTIAFELAIEAQYYDFKVTELPFSSYNRVAGGKSHFKILPRVYSYGQVFLWGIFKLWKK